MAYITVTSSTNQIIVDTGVYGGMNTAFGLLPNKATLPKSNFKLQYFAGSHVELLVLNGTAVRTWSLTTDGAGGTLQVDAINGVAPTDLADLFTKAAALTA